MQKKFLVLAALKETEIIFYPNYSQPPSQVQYSLAGLISTPKKL